MATTSTDPRVERSRAAVLDAAGALLLGGGVRAVTVEAIVERSGVARSTIYRHWGTRDDLVIAALDRLVPPPPEPDPAGPFEERLVTLLESQARRFTEAPWSRALVTLLDACFRDPELTGLAERIEDHHRGVVLRTLRRAVEEGDLPADTDVEEAIAQLGGPMLFRHLLQAEPVDGAFARRMVELFLASRRSSGSSWQ